MDVKEIGPDRAEELETLVRELRKKMAWTPGWLKAEVAELVRYEIELDRIKRNS